MLKVHSIRLSILTCTSKMPSQETFRDVQTSKAVSIGVENLKSWERKKSCVLGRKKNGLYSLAGGSRHKVQCSLGIRFWHLLVGVWNLESPP